jgi:hypothetical protein
MEMFRSINSYKTITEMKVQELSDQVKAVKAQLKYYETELELANKNKDNIECVLLSKVNVLLLSKKAKIRELQQLLDENKSPNIAREQELVNFQVGIEDNVVHTVSLSAKKEQRSRKRLTKVKTESGNLINDSNCSR